MRYLSHVHYNIISENTEVMFLKTTFKTNFNIQYAASGNTVIIGNIAVLFSPVNVFI